MEERWNETLKQELKNKNDIYDDDYFPKIKILDKGDQITCNFSLETIVLTDEYISAIKNEKALNFDIADGEYAGLIIHEDSLKNLKLNKWVVSTNREHGKCPFCGAGEFDLVGGFEMKYCPSCGERVYYPTIEEQNKMLENYKRSHEDE